MKILEEQPFWLEPIVPYGKERIKVKYKENAPKLVQHEKGGCIDLYNYNEILFGLWFFARVHENFNF